MSNAAKSTETPIGGIERQLMVLPKEFIFQKDVELMGEDTQVGQTQGQWWDAMRKVATWHAHPLARANGGITVHAWAFCLMSDSGTS